MLLFSSLLRTSVGYGQMAPHRLTACLATVCCDGVVVVLHLQVAIRALGFEVKKADVMKIIKDYDREGKGKVTFQDFFEIS